MTSKIHGGGGGVQTKEYFNLQLVVVVVARKASHPRTCFTLQRLRARGSNRSPSLLKRTLVHKLHATRGPSSISVCPHAIVLQY